MSFCPLRKTGFVSEAGTTLCTEHALLSVPTVFLSMALLRNGNVLPGKGEGGGKGKPGLGKVKYILTCVVYPHLSGGNSAVWVDLNYDLIDMLTK